MKPLLTGCLVLGVLCGAAVLCAQAMDNETATRTVTTVYRDLLGRDPDPEGLREWRTKLTAQKWSEKDVRKELMKSDEYKKGGVDRIINSAYMTVLGRAPDPTGRRIMTEKITKERWGDKQVRAALRDSDEYRKKSP